MNEKIHQQVRQWLESDQPLDAKTEAALQDHLRVCVDCRNYVKMITDLEKGSWNPFPRHSLSQAERQTVMNQMRPQLQKNKLNPAANFFNLSSALAMVGLLVIVGFFALAISQMNQTAVPSAASTPVSENYTQYDGWETGLAFQFPATWTIVDFYTDDSSAINFATPLNETAAPCTEFVPSNSNAGIWIAPLDEAMPLTPLEFFHMVIELDADSVQEPPQAVTVNGRSAAYARSELPCEAPFNQVTIMTAQTDTHHVWLSARHAASDTAAARTELETIITSLSSVDYTGWQPWRPAEFNFTVMTPAEWNVFDALKSLELTTSSQPMWSSLAVPNQPANPLRMIIFHNLNSQFGSTPQAVVEQHIAQMEAELTMQQVEPPTAHPIIPELVTAVYTTEDTAVFFGAIAFPHDNLSLDPIGASATVPLDQLDSFRPTFERVLRSLNGYYGNLAGISLRNTITGGNFAPTATPILATQSPEDGFSTPTPTPYDFVTADPAWTATAILPTASPPNPLFITPTPTAFTLPSVDPNATPTAYLPTPTPMPRPTEP